MQFNSIPAKNIAAVYPAVIGGGGNPLGLNTVLLASEAVFPNYEYSSATLVGQHYGLNSDIYNFAVVYFNGFEGATTRPNSLFISQYNKVDVAASLTSGDVSGLTDAQIQAVNGTLTITIDGTLKNVTVNLSTANSLSDAAALIATALAVPVTYESTVKGFVIKSGTTGTGSSVTFGSGAVANTLKLTQATAATLNNNTTADTTETVTERVLEFSPDFVNFTYTDGTLDDDSLKAMATWVTQQDSRFKLYTWGLDPLALSQSGLSFGEWAKENTAGVVPIYGTFDKAAFFCGVSGSVNYEETNGRTTTAFRTQEGLVADVTRESDAATLEANGYSFYGAWAVIRNRFQMAGIGAVTGKFKWIDNFDFQVFLNTGFQLAMVNMLRGQNTIPYTEDGVAAVRAYFQDPINQGLNFGGIRAGVTLSDSQKFQVVQESGIANAANQLFTQGYVLSVVLPSASARAARESFIIKFFYTDGSSMQKIEMTSTNVQ